jgi:hypothetical protein
MHHISRRVEHINWKADKPEAASLEGSLTRRLTDDAPLDTAPELPPREGSPSPESPTRARRVSMESIISTGPAVTPVVPSSVASPTFPPPQSGETSPELPSEKGDSRRKSMESIISTGGTKRPREDAEVDENPREAKRVSPPPEKTDSQSTPPGPSTPGPSTSKIVCRNPS